MDLKSNELETALDPSMALYVLIDPLGGDPVANPGVEPAGDNVNVLREQAWGREVKPVVLAKSVELLPHQCPYLVRLQGPDDPWLAVTMRIADEERTRSQSDGLDGHGGVAHRIGGWLQADPGALDVADIVSAMCRVNTSFITKARYLRHADRRVVDLLCHVAGTARIAGQFGRLRSWFYLDPMARIRHIDSAGELAQPLYLDNREWRRIESSELLHCSVAKYLGELERAGGLFPPSVYQGAEQAAVEVAKSVRRWPHRFVHRDDRTTWVALTMLYPFITQVETVQKALAGSAMQTDPPEPLRYMYREIVALAEAAKADMAFVNEPGI